LIPLHTVSDVQAAEQAVIDAGVTESDLMHRAAIAMFHEVSNEFDDAGHAVVFAGPGKNGGDGVLLAKLLDQTGWSVDVWCWSRDKFGDAPISDDDADQINWLVDQVALRESLKAADLVLDAVFGAGSRPELPDEVGQAFELVRSQREAGYVPIWAIDLPSGVSADTGEIADDALAADVSLAIGMPKIGLYQQPAASIAGEIRLLDIGLQPAEGASDKSVFLLTADLARKSLPERRTGVHKRSAGTLLVIGGSPNYYGAPRLTGEAALRAGAGLVMVAAPSSIIPPMATTVPELTFLPLPVSEQASAGSRMAEIVGKRIDDFEASVIGPGLGTETPVPEFLSQLLGLGQANRGGIGFGTFAEPEPTEPFAGRAVIDADGLNWLARIDEWWTTIADASLVLTPHPGELARLLKVERDEIERDPWTHVRNAAHTFGQAVVLKYGHSVVASPDGQLFIAENAPVGLATAGTGDVLAGIIGSLMAQGLEPLDAAVAGVALGSEAALMLQDSVGQTGYLATDLIALLPEAREVVRTCRPTIMFE
jgi:ADP-dependent NAD(P)H-hydrate dehydratase / NAD(P)H-hydrate epimerase